MATDIDSTELRALLETLPQELYDEVYNLTFAFSPGTRIVDETWNPSHLLAVDTASRHQAAISYFGSGNVFLLRKSGSFHHSMVQFPSRWLLSIGIEHFKLIESIRIVGNLSEYVPRYLSANLNIDRRVLSWLSTRIKEKVGSSLTIDDLYKRVRWVDGVELDKAHVHE